MASFNMWLKQCHKPPMTGNGNHTTNIDDWGMVYEIGLPILITKAELRNLGNELHNSKYPR